MLIYGAGASFMWRIDFDDYLTNTNFRPDSIKLRKKYSESLTSNKRICE